MNEIETKGDPSIQVEISVEGLLFDMDGVLVQSTGGDERCWLRWAKQYDLGGRFDLRKTHGRRASDFLRDLIPAATADEILAHVAVLDRFAEHEHSNVAAYPGVVELLAGVPSYRWTVVTSTSEKMMRRRLSAARITPPPHAVGGDTVALGKPHPEGYLRGAAILTRRPEECLVIEDAPTGVRAAKSAGCQVLAIASTHRPAELKEADWIVASLAELRVEVDPETATLNLKIRTIRRDAELLR